MQNASNRSAAREAGLHIFASLAPAASYPKCCTSLETDKDDQRLNLCVWWPRTCCQKKGLGLTELHNILRRLHQLCAANLQVSTAPRQISTSALHPTGLVATYPCTKHKNEADLCGQCKPVPRLVEKKTRSSSGGVPAAIHLGLGRHCDRR